MSFTASLIEIVEKNENGLLSAHKSWSRVPLGTVAEILNGFPFDSKFFGKTDGVPLLRIRDILGKVIETRYSGPIPEGFWIHHGDLIVGMDGDFNCASWRGEPALLNQRVCKILARPTHVNETFLYHVLGGYLKVINAYTSSITVKHLSSKTIAEIPLPFPPLNEQKRIADKLDAVFARVDTCRDRLDRVPSILKRFRQSVLAAATSGKLTEEWRNTNEETGFGFEVIETDAKSKAAMLVADESLSKKKSSANSDIDESHTFELPKTWAFSTWGRISEWITYGFTRPMPSTKDGKKLVTAKDVLNFHIRIDGAGHTSNEAFSELSDKDRPRKGDLLITKDGTIGRAAIVNTDEPFCINQSVAVCWLRSTCMNKRYLEFVANAEFTQKFVFEKSKGMAIQHLSIIDFAQCPVPVPSLKEQTEIVRRVETLFAYADRLEARYASARAQTVRLTPALLAKAFRGELVPQEPNDEPASELIERITVERALKAITLKRTTSKRKEGVSMKPRSVIPVIEALRSAKKPLSAQALLVEAGYPSDADTELVERFFLDIRKELEENRIEQTRKGNDDFFSIVP